MFDFWKARRARRAAVAAIEPFVNLTRQRLGEIPASSWSSSYVIGFVGTLITLYAERDVGELGSSMMASVQQGAWSDISRTESVLLGENICFLSTAGEDTFALGCRNAAAFFEGLQVADSQDARIFDSLDAMEAIPSVNAELGSALWLRYFDSYIGSARATVLDGMDSQR